MSHIVVDLEKGASALFHALPEGVSDGTALPPEAAGVVRRFATALGIPDAEMTANAAGWLFDIVNHAVEAIAPSETVHAAAPAAPAAGAPALQEPGVQAQEPPVETAPASNERQATEAERALAASPDLTHEPEHGPADVDLPPVTEPQADHEICPKCSGFRTVLESGAVVVCPVCRGAGEIGVGTAPQA